VVVNKPRHICNAWMASAVGEPFWDYVLEEVRRQDPVRLSATPRLNVPAPRLFARAEPVHHCCRHRRRPPHCLLVLHPYTTAAATADATATVPLTVCSLVLHLYTGPAAAATAAALLATHTHDRLGPGKPTGGACSVRCAALWNGARRRWRCRSGTRR
jgi:hypothetical protein